ncbi:MAG: AI-2E family transporter [Geobacteraceae bacterium]|nr:AI-2E family transporter [Geobacteraceae bacterium]
MFFAILFCFAAIIAAAYFVGHTFSAVLTSLVIAYLLNPQLKYIEKKGFNRLTALLLLYGVVSFVAFLASFILIPYLGHQVDALVKALPLYIRNLQFALDKWQSKMSGYYGGDEGAWVLGQITRAVEELTSYLSSFGLYHLKNLFFAGFNLILSPILVFFMLLYKQHAKDFVRRMFHHSDRQHLIELGRELNRSLERFLVGMFFDCLFVAILTSIALALLGVEFPLLNGFFAGFATIIPFLGAIVAVIPPALIGYLNSGDIWIIPKVCAAYFVINVIIEGNLIKPLVMRHTLRLNPLAVIFVVMSMGELLGFWGVVLAIPSAAVFKICTQEMRHLLGIKVGESN